MSEIAMRTRSFRAMGTEVVVLGPVGSELTRVTAAVRSLVAREELRFSRFRADSELSRVNASAGTWIGVTPPFAEVLALALDAARRTQGLFDPTVHDALVALGYDRDFDDVIAGARAAIQPAAPCGRWAEIEHRDLRVRLPRGVALDLGGIVKGWTADLAAVRTADRLGWGLVSLGGDLRLAGAPPEPIRVDVEDPDQPERALVGLQLQDGALASSSTVGRSWGPGVHHLIDPRRGGSIRTDVRQATAWAPTAAAAEIEAKRLLFAGEAGLDDVPGVVVTGPGRAVTNLGAEVAA